MSKVKNSKTPFANDSYAYEDDIKLFILKNRELFIKHDEEAVALFEKGIVHSHTLTDCLIFSGETGLVGIEIKTAHDGKKRLRRQLKDYTAVCDYVYVLIHDVMYTEVQDILQEYAQVGIYCYNEIKGHLVVGLIRPAVYNRHNYATTLDTMWYTELRDMLSYLCFEHGKKIPKVHGKKGMEHYMLTHFNVEEVVKTYYYRVIDNKHDPDKYEKHYRL